MRGSSKQHHYLIQFVTWCNVTEQHSLSWSAAVDDLFRCDEMMKILIKLISLLRIKVAPLISSDSSAAEERQRRESRVSYGTGVKTVRSYGEEVSGSSETRQSRRRAAVKRNLVVYLQQKKHVLYPNYLKVTN